MADDPSCSAWLPAADQAQHNADGRSRRPTRNGRMPAFCRVTGLLPRLQLLWGPPSQLPAASSGYCYTRQGKLDHGCARRGRPAGIRALGLSPSEELNVHLGWPTGQRQRDPIREMKETGSTAVDRRWKAGLACVNPHLGWASFPLFTYLQVLFSVSCSLSMFIDYIDQWISEPLTDRHPSASRYWRRPTSYLTISDQQPRSLHHVRCHPPDTAHE